MNADRLLIHAIEALHDGNRALAGVALARLVRQDPTNLYAWLWLSRAVDEPERQRYCLERALSIDPSNVTVLRKLDALDQFSTPTRPEKPDAEFRPPADTLPVTLFAAGVKFDQRPEVVRQLRLRQPIRLRREPDNPHDANAIRLETQAGAQFGFVRKEATPILAPYMDEKGEPLDGMVTELFSDLEGGNLRVGVAFFLPEDAMELQDSLTQLEEGTPEIAWLLERNSGAAYVLIDGSEEDLRRARRALQADGIAFTKYGVTFHPASDGCFYKWYLHLSDANTDERRVEACLKKRFDIRPSARAYHDAEELAAFFDDDRAKAVERLNQTVAQLAFYQGEVRRLQEQSASFDWGQLRETLYSMADDLCPEHLLKLIECLFSDRVIVLESAYTAAEAVPHFRNSRRAFELLWKLATDYTRLMLSGDGHRATCEDLFGGDCYAAQDNSDTDKQRGARTFDYDGTPIFMPEHLKIGVSWDANETLRIHFKWLNDEGKVVIGHCGKHLP